MDAIIIKKVVTALLYPTSIILVSGCFMVVFKKFKAIKLSRLCCSICLVSFLLSSNLMFARWLTRSLELQYPQTPIEKIKEHDVVIVLGGGLRIPTPPAQQTQLSASSDRYWYAVQLYRAGKAKRILISAGNIVEQRGLHSEAFYARELLGLWGVPSDLVLIESNSRTTFENHQQVASLIKSNDIRSALLVTSALHMPRAYSLFKDLPIKITPATSDVLVRDADSIGFLNWIPSANAMKLTTAALHEYYAIWYGRLNAIIFNS